MPTKKAAKQPKPDAVSAPKEKTKEQSLEESFNQMQQMALDGFKAIESNLREIQQLFTDFEGRVADLSNRVNSLEGGTEIPTVPAGKESKEGADDLQKRLREVGKKIGQKLREIQGEGLSTKKGI